MNSWQRLKNLWRMSGMQVIEQGEPQSQGTYKPFFVKKQKQATIIDMSDPIEEFPQKEA